MNRSLSALALACFATLPGCDLLEEKVKREHIENATILFKPDEAHGLVDQWYYEFQTDGSSVLGCNSKEVFKATELRIYEDEGRVLVHFGSDWEEYFMRIDDSAFEDEDQAPTNSWPGADSETEQAPPDLERGTFDYNNSIGTRPMTGEWKRVDSKPCSSRLR